MGGGLKAHTVGQRAEEAVDRLAARLGLVRVAKRPFSARGRRAWGTRRLLDRIYTLPGDTQEYWVEVKAQAGPGSAFERIVALVQVDFPTWNHWGKVVVVQSAGIPERCALYLHGMGAVNMAELEADMRAFVQQAEHQRVHRLPKSF